MTRFSKNPTTSQDITSHLESLALIIGMMEKNLPQPEDLNMEHSSPEQWVEFLRNKVREKWPDSDPVIILGTDPQDTWDLLVKNLDRIRREKGIPVHSILPTLEKHIKEQGQNFLAFDYRNDYLLVVAYSVPMVPFLRA